MVLLWCVFLHSKALWTSTRDSLESIVDIDIDKVVPATAWPQETTGAYFQSSQARVVRLVAFRGAVVESLLMFCATSNARDGRLVTTG
jgi:hypothetical protein